MAANDTVRISKCKGISVRQARSTKRFFAISIAAAASKRSSSFFRVRKAELHADCFPRSLRCHPQHLRKVSRQALRRQRRMPPSHTMTSSRHECHSLPSGRTKREFHPPLASSSEDIAAAPAQQTPRCCVHLHKKQKSYVSYNPQPTDLPARSRRRAYPGAWECKKR